MNNIDLDLKVKEANKQFYNIIASVYEKLDGRRTAALDQWVEEKLYSLSKSTGGRTLLDLGCGTGVVLRNGKKYFRHLYGIDISQQMLKKLINGEGICADLSNIPFKNDSVDVAVCFSVLHHIYDPKDVFREIYRVLKKDGLFYIDHDIDNKFVKKFYPFIKIYRYIFNSAKKYMKSKSEITKVLYNLTEIHSNGIDSIDILKQLRDIGFSRVEVFYHWFGLSGFINKIIKYRRFKRGFAPLLCIVGKK